MAEPNPENVRRRSAIKVQALFWKSLTQIYLTLFSLPSDLELLNKAY